MLSIGYKIKKGSFFRMAEGDYKIWKKNALGISYRGFGKNDVLPQMALINTDIFLATNLPTGRQVTRINTDKKSILIFKAAE